MEKLTFLAAMAAVSIFTLVGCAHERPAPTAADTNPAHRTYTREDLNKTGRHQTGPALEAVDPSVTATDGR